ncbi:UvrD-helicase domain-containing protein [Thiotrichales bacterium 19S9-12]|nr:UvrD-helicase domain-containing protein [Thiotrichales bacterium 19S9-11]MCF6812338.1 UvrD-helicase domain-containing protein [Thiotrichales bacterium 19S9-12]
MKQLNPQQQQAVEYIDGPLLVLAGAGSGKTSVITQKIAYLIKSGAYKANQILAVTFTNKAAREMRQRVNQAIDKKLTRGISISTFHTFGLNILKKDITHLGYQKNFSLLDDRDSLILISELAYEKYQVNKEIIQQIAQQISLWKSALILPEDIGHISLNSDQDKMAFDTYGLYQHYLKAYNAVDFDDLILLPTLLFKKFPNCLEKWKSKIHYLLIDEYQDTNLSQYQLISQLIKPRGRFTVVGDDDQSIYAWRGAEPENLNTLQHDFPNLKVIKLEQNYRSTGRILKAANTLIEHNPHLFEKKLWSSLHFGDPIRAIMTKNEEDESQRAVTEILSHKFKNNTEYSDYAILYRSNHQSFLLEKYLREYNVPYYINGGISFFARTEIKDITAYLRLITNPEDDRSFLRIINTPKREIGHKTLEVLGSYANQRQIPYFYAINEVGLQSQLKPKVYERLVQFSTFIEKSKQKLETTPNNQISNCLVELVEIINYKQWLIDNSSTAAQADKRFENIVELINWIEKAINKVDDETNETRSLSDVINQLLILDMIDTQEQEDNQNQVQLLTLHAAKGLEYPHVYLIGMEDGILPHQQNIDNNQIEEERRLTYVGITRARETLTFLLTKSRKRFGDHIPSKSSRFLEELPEEDLVWHGKEPECESKRKSTAKRNINELRKLIKKS